MSDILLGQSYYLRFDPKLLEAMQPYPPLGSLYAASLLRQHGHGVAFFDAMLAESEDAWAAALVTHKPRYAILFEDNFNYLSKMCLLRMRQAAFTMIRMARDRQCTVILCGADASDHPGDYLAHGADFVLQGEGDMSLVELLDRLSGRTELPLDQIHGLIYLAENDGQVIRTRRRADIRDLDALPYPAWDLVDVQRYRRIWLKSAGYFAMNVATTRGCPFHCNWCAKPIWGQRYNCRSPQNVAAELKWLRDTYHPDHITFVDDIFGLKPGWLEQFAASVAQLDCRLPFKCLSRVDLLARPGEIEMLKKSGCRMVWVGAESGSQKILDAMEKGTRVEQIRSTARSLHAAGIQVGFFLQFGYPGESRADIDMTLQMVRDCEPDDIGMSVSYPLPGTRFYDAVRQQLGAKQNWEDSNDMAMLYRGPFGTGYYRRLHCLLHREFRARKYAKTLRQLFRQPGTARSAHLKQLMQLVYYTLTLPILRLQLNRMEKSANQPTGHWLPLLSAEQAAVPSAQNET